MTYKKLASVLACGVCIVAMATPASAQTQTYNIPAGSLKSALDAYGRQSGRPIIYKADDIRRVRSSGAQGNLTAEAALDAILERTGLIYRTDTSGAIAITSGEATAGSAAADNESAEIVVTGSHISNVSPTSPVHMVTRKDIEASGYSQVGDLMRSLPENFSGGPNPGVIAASATNIENTNVSNSSTVNLRGLGTGATLTLINGHRLSADADTQGVDISVIPLSAIERVEVVSDGASAVYGSDAVAGVVNFILRKNYSGAEISANLGTSTKGGGFSQVYSALGGVSRQSWYLLGNYEYQHQNSITASQREIASQSSPTNTLIQPQTRHSLFVTGGVEVSDSTTFTIDSLISERKSLATRAYDPTSTVFYTEVSTPSYNVAGTLASNVANDWNIRLTGVASGSSNNFTQTDSVNSPSYEYSFRNFARYVEFVADGSLVKLPSGDLKIAVGGGYRHEGFADSDISPTRNITYFFGELFAPLVRPSVERNGLQEFDISLSVRTERYSDFGRATNPRIGFRYVPFRDLTLHGSWGRSFKAPTFVQMYLAQGVAAYPGRFFGLGPADQSLFVGGGNRNLKPERSRSWTIGADYRPSFLNSAKLSVNYFDVDYTDRVVNPITNPSMAFSDDIYRQFVTLNPSSVAQTDLIGGADSFSDYTGVGYSAAAVRGILDNRYVNAASQKVRGFDLSYRQSFRFGQNEIDAFGNATWVTLDQRTTNAVPSVRLSGTIFNVPDFKARGGLTWLRDGLSATAIVNYVSGETDTGIIPNAHISSWTTIDTN